ncbi:MAG: hypothetical protein ACFFG0_35940 [Candidatus Thorarchaeota archaeon]
MVLIISIFIQITIFLIVQLSNWISQKPVKKPWFIFLTQTIEPYSDYKIWYQTFGRQTLFGGWLPYMEIFDVVVTEEEWYNFWFVENEGLFLNFIYPPLFFYILILPSFISIELMFLPLLITNVLLPIAIFKLLSKSFSQKVAEWGFIATALNPLYLFYNGGLVLNSSLITLFFILALYYLSEHRYGYTILFLGISILFKQIILFLVPPILMYISLNSDIDQKVAFLNNNKKKFLYYSVILIIILFIGSLPWILVTPGNYLFSVFAPGILPPTIFPAFHFPYPHYHYPIFWYDFLYNVKAPYIVFWVFGFLNFTYIGIIILEIIITYMVYSWHRKNILNWVKFFDIIIYSAFLCFLFFPRGLYKYYFSYYVPLIVLWICFHFGNKLSNNSVKGTNWILVIILISIIFMLLPRTIYLILIWGVFFYILKKNSILTKDLEASISIEISSLDLKKK